jgi:hypothetical protein
VSFPNVYRYVMAARAAAWSLEPVTFRHNRRDRQPAAFLEVVVDAGECIPIELPDRIEADLLREGVLVPERRGPTVGLHDVLVAT